MNNHEAPQQQHEHRRSTQADFYGFSSVPHQPPMSIIHRPPATSFGSVASATSTTSTASKRGRDDGTGSGLPTFTAPQHFRHQQTTQHHHNPHEHASSSHHYHFLGNHPQHTQHSTTASSDTSYTPDDSYGGPSITPKRARPSNYQAPRAVKPSLLSAMGTLASPTATTTNGTTTLFSRMPPAMASSASTTTVPMRRRLSGGHLEEYLGNHDNMDMDGGSDGRPRSMSF